MYADFLDAVCFQSLYPCFVSKEMFCALGSHVKEVRLQCTAGRCSPLSLSSEGQFLFTLSYLHVFFFSFFLFFVICLRCGKLCMTV